MRYRAAVGVGEEAHSRQRHWCPWSKSVNVETWGHVPDPIVMAHTFAELGKGTMARARDNRFKSGRNLGHTLYGTTYNLKIRQSKREEKARSESYDAGIMKAEGLLTRREMIHPLLGRSCWFLVGQVAQGRYIAGQVVVLL